MALTWYLADLKTGQVYDELPIQTQGVGLERTVSKGMASALSVLIHDPRCPDNWTDLIGPGRSMIVPVWDGVPLHGFIPTRPQHGRPVAQLQVESIESVMRSAFCRTRYYDGSVDEAQIAADLIADRIAGQFGLELEVTDCSQASEREYSLYEDRRVSAALDELTGRWGGPEWTIRVVWDDADMTRFAKVVEIGPRIGRMIESTVIEDRHVLDRSREQDWTAGDAFANALWATGDGSGESRPMSPLLVDGTAADLGHPLWEARVTAPTLDEESALTEYGDAALAARRLGSQSWEITLDLTQETCPRPGIDFDAGDTVTMDLRPTRDDPGSWQGPARLIGWRMQGTAHTLTELSPVFWDPRELEVA